MPTRMDEVDGSLLFFDHFKETTDEPKLLMGGALGVQLVLITFEVNSRGFQELLPHASASYLMERNLRLTVHGK